MALIEDLADGEQSAGTSIHSGRRHPLSPIIVDLAEVRSEFVTLQSFRFSM